MYSLYFRSKKLLRLNYCVAKILFRAYIIQIFISSFSAGFALCAGGGVLLATVMVHMVREVRESLDRAAGLGVSLPQDFPVAELVICCGFLLILLIESAAHKHFGGHSHSHLPPSRASNKVNSEISQTNLLFFVVTIRLLIARSQ